MKFSCAFGRHETLEETAELARAAEENGFDQMTIIDSQNLSRDVYVQLAVAAMNTSRIRIGTGVTNPITRHPTVTANAIASINELSGGRAFLGLGGGISSVWTMGVKTQPLRDVREMVGFLRAYMAGEDAEYKGTTAHSEWVRQTVPIYLGSGGPKSLFQAGQIADGIIATGSRPEVVKWRCEQIKRGASEVGRDASEIDIWARIIVYVTDDDPADALPETGHYATQAGYSVLHEPHFEELRNKLQADEPGIIEEFKAVADAYEPYAHEAKNARHGKFATQRVVDFYHLVGTADSIVERIHTLRDCGVTNISCVLYTLHDKIGMMRRISQEIMPRVRDL
jgi:5,10-methylenetetrahydromethanopterin reductase